MWSLFINDQWVCDSTDIDTLTDRGLFAGLNGLNWHVCDAKDAGLFI